MVDDALVVRDGYHGCRWLEGGVCIIDVRLRADAGDLCSGLTSRPEHGKIHRMRVSFLLAANEKIQRAEV